MTETNQFKLPLLQAAQAQKHVTVNEALAILDAMAQLRVTSRNISVPPTNAIDGETYIVGTGAVNAWSGQDVNLAIFSNGGWVFLTPRIGWKVWIIDTENMAIFDQTDWRENAEVIASGGAATLNFIEEFDHTILTGPTSTTSVDLSFKTQVMAVTARVLSDVTGASITGWDLGISGDTTRFASGLALSQNTQVIAPSSSIITYLSNTPLLLTANGGDFTGGQIRFAIHYFKFKGPRKP